jgi:uncharacterized protein YndB with AHSA1/START domain
MTVTSVHKDPEALTMTVHASFGAPIERVWQLWDDPRQLERWWGPPVYPATVAHHELRAGGTMSYFMTGPQGDQPHGWWRVLEVDAPKRLVFLNGFGDANGEPDPAMPTMTFRVELSAGTDGATSMTVEIEFPSLGAMTQVMSMGMEEGFTLAMSQIDAMLEEGATH